MSKLHTIQCPDSITPEQLDQVFEILGLPANRCERLTLYTDRVEARLALENLVGGIVGWAEVTIPMSVGKP